MSKFAIPVGLMDAHRHRRAARLGQPTEADDAPAPGVPDFPLQDNGRFQCLSCRKDYASLVSARRCRKQYAIVLQTNNQTTFRHACRPPGATGERPSFTVLPSGRKLCQACHKDFASAATFRR